MKPNKLTKILLMNPINSIKSKNILVLESPFPTEKSSFSPVKTVLSTRDYYTPVKGEFTFEHFPSVNTERLKNDQLNLSDVSNKDIKELQLNKFRSNEEVLVIRNYMETRKKNLEKRKKEKNKYDIKPLKNRFPKLALQLEKLETYNVKAEKRIKKFKNDIHKIDMKIFNKTSMNERKKGKNIIPHMKIDISKTIENDKNLVSSLSPLPKVSFKNSSSELKKLVITNSTNFFGKTFHKSEEKIINNKIISNVLKKDSRVLSSVLEKCEKIERYNYITNQKIKSIKS